MRWTAEIQFLAGAVMGIFLFATAFIPVLGAHPASCPRGTRSSFPGNKVARV